METGNGNRKEIQPFSFCSPRKIRVLLAFVLGSPEISSPPVFDHLLCYSLAFSPPLQVAICVLANTGGSNG